MVGFHEKLANYLWYRSQYLWKILLPFEGLYRSLLFLRKKCIKPVVHYPVPVIVVGNITVGGTGKTPFVIALVKYLKSQGYVPGVVSRGYGRRQTQLCYVTQASDPAEVGDEPAMIAAATLSPVVVAKQRVEAVQALLAREPQCNVVVSDDGLQHLRLKRDIAICIVDAKKKFGNQHCLPAGPLREPIQVLKEMDLVLENGVDFVVEPEVFISIEEEKDFPLNFFEGKKVYAIAGIAHPERFFESLRQLGAIVIPKIFPDHYFFSEKELGLFTEFPLIMTEKDAVKCRKFSNLKSVWFLRVNVKFSLSLQKELINKLHF